MLEIDAPQAQAPLLSIFGGKITTYRRLAEAALTRLSPYFPELETRAGWTAQAPLPGGELAVDGIAGLEADLCRRYPFLSATHAKPLGAIVRATNSARSWFGVVPR